MIPPADQDDFAFILDQTPHAFLNVETGRVVLMASQWARFRASTDSLDLFLATRAPVRDIRAVTATNVSVRGDAWLFGVGDAEGIHDSLTFDGSGYQTWTFRVPPRHYLYRLEATADNALLAGQATRWVNGTSDLTAGFPLAGFGMSDPLLAWRVTPIVATPSRWHEFTATALLEPAQRGAQVELLWETYELGARNGAADYEIAVTLQRARAGPGRIAAQILGAIAGAVGVERSGDRVVMRFPRTRPHAPVVVDQVTLALGETPPGTYTITIQIKDQVSGRTVSRTAPLTISP
jgi:hypothetical protein